MNNQDIAYIQEAIQYRFKNPALLQQAFTRSSYSAENGGEDNEVLEFIGDKVLDFVIVKKLTEKYGSYADKYEDYNEFVSKFNEGKLTDLKKKLVCRSMLSSRIRQFAFQYSLIMGESDIENDARDSESVQEDLFEAIIGAVALDSNWNIARLTNVVDLMLDPDFYLDNGFDNDENYVELLQQWYQKRHKMIPVYVFRDTGGFPSFGKYGRWACEVGLPPLDQGFHDVGNTKSEARMIVAKKAYEYLTEKGLMFTLIDEIGEPCRERAINQLQELYQKGYIEEPEYVFELSCDSNGYASFVCKCSVVKEGNEHCWGGIASSKKEAKKEAALNVLNSVLGKVEISCRVSGDREMLRRGGFKG